MSKFIHRMSQKVKQKIIFNVIVISGLYCFFVMFSSYQSGEPKGPAFKERTKAPSKEITYVAQGVAMHELNLGLYDDFLSDGVMKLEGMLADARGGARAMRGDAYRAHHRRVEEAYYTYYPKATWVEPLSRIFLKYFSDEQLKIALTFYENRSNHGVFLILLEHGATGNIKKLPVNVRSRFSKEDFERVETFLNAEQGKSFLAGRFKVAAQARKEQKEMMKLRFSEVRSTF